MKNRFKTNATATLRASFFAAIISILGACNKTIEKPTEKQVNNTSVVTKPVQEEKAVTSRVVFTSYNDNDNYFLLNATENNVNTQFINNLDDRSLLYGDIIDATWKNDTIYMAGDGDTPAIAKHLLSFKKVKDGNVSLFRKKYPKQLKYHYATTASYSKSYLDELYLLTESYIANTKNTLLLDIIAHKEQIECSIEEQTRNNQEYTVIGIGKVFEHRTTTVQWLYYNIENHTLYEYDLPNDKLLPFSTN